MPSCATAPRRATSRPFGSPARLRSPRWRAGSRTPPKFDAVVCLGCVIRGGTDHYQFVAAEAAKGIAHVALESPVPVVFGVLTTESIEQAIERAGTKMGNKGADAVMTAIEMVNLGVALDKQLEG